MRAHQVLLRVYRSVTEDLPMTSVQAIVLLQRKESKVRAKGERVHR